MDEPVDELHHLGDVLRCPRIVVCPLLPEGVELHEEGVVVGADVFLQPTPALGHSLHDAVIDVG